MTLTVKPERVSAPEIIQIQAAIRRDPGYAKLYAIFDPDAAGWLEVLAQATDLSAITVWLRRDEDSAPWEVVAVNDGW